MWYEVHTRPEIRPSIHPLPKKNASQHMSRPTCSLPVAEIAYGGQCRPIVKGCGIGDGLPELSSSVYRSTPTGSENAFVNRFGTPSAASGGGGNRRRRRHIKRRSLTRRRLPVQSRQLRQHRSRSQSAGKRRTRTRKSKRRGGVGFRLDLAGCPPGGMPGPEQYETHIAL
jgi:hypothetical protein